jgi:hypothetical protein
MGRAAVERAGRRCTVLAAVLLLTLTACGGGSTSPSTSGASTSRTSSSPSLSAVATPTPTATSTTALGDRPAPGFVPATASFPTPQIGYAWGIAPCVHDRTLLCPGMVGTTDGGTSWRVLNAPVGVPTDPYQRAMLRFSDPSNGWAALNGIQVTHDGGVSWQAVGLPGVRLPRIADVETGVGVAYVVASDGAVTGSPLRLYETTAISNTFTVVPNVALDAAGADVSLSLSLDGRGYLTGNAVGGPPKLYAMGADGGWAPRTSPCGTGTTATVAAGPANQTTVVCDGLPSATGAPKAGWFSADGGESFTQTAAPAGTGFTAAGAVVPDAPPPLTITSSAPATPTDTASSGSLVPGRQTGLSIVFVATARSDRIYLTENGGRSWTVAFASSGDASGSGLGLADLEFSDPTHGAVILGDAGLYARDRAAGRHVVPGPRLLTTQDGGKHWAQSVISEG